MNDFSRTHFFNQFSPEVKKLLEFVLSKGFYVTLVGGAVRDYLKSKKLPTDLDFEIRHHSKIKEQEWIKKITKLQHEITSAGYKVEDLPFSILRVHLEGSEIELSSPRFETFSDSVSSYGHKDFKAQLDPSMEYPKAFARRDFSYNAIGIEITDLADLSKVSLIDPFSGVKDLGDNTLTPVGDNFFKDPVRFLRMIRFCIAFKSKFSDKLEKDIGLFDLQKLTLYYLFREAFKVGFFPFLEVFSALVNRFELNIGQDIRKLIQLPWDRVSFLRACDLQSVLIATVFDQSSSFTKDQIIQLGTVTEMKKGISKSLIEYRTLLESRELDISSLEQKIGQMSPDKIAHDSDLNFLCKFHSIRKGLEKHWEKIGEFLSEDHKNQHATLSNLVPVSLLGADEFAQLTEKISHIEKKKSCLRLYAHLMVHFKNQ